MNNELRTIVQTRLINTYNLVRKGIIRASIRVGKTYCGLMTIKENTSVLICYPRVSIKKSWIAEMQRIDYVNSNITFSTFASLKKLVKAGEKFDEIKVDECHKMSTAQKGYLLKLTKSGDILGLTGTLKLSNEKSWRNLGLNVIATYDLEDAINDGLVKDYRITVKFIDLSAESMRLYKEYTSLIDILDAAIKHPSNEKHLKSLKLKYYKYLGFRTNLIYNAESLMLESLKLLELNKHNKSLIFSLRTAVATELSENTYHSKQKNEEFLEEFKLAENGHLSTCNMIAEGITIQKLNTIICHTITSNTEDFQQKLGRGLQLGEVDNEICNVYIFCLKDTVQENWVEQATTSMNPNKISYEIDGKLYSKIEYLKLKNPDKELYSYKGSICYPINKVEPIMYRFLNQKGDKTYPLRNIIKL